MSWLARFTAPWRLSTEVLDALMRIERAVDSDVPAQLTRMETRMAADRDLLAEIASGLTALSAPVSDLIASEAALRARVVELEGQSAADEAGDLQAAQSVKSAFDGIADKFRSEPEVPDVEPLPEVPAESEAPAVEDENPTPPAA